MKLHLFFVLIAGFSLLSCQGQDFKNYENIEATAFAKKIDATPQAQIIDVRTPQEYSSQHLDNAKNINWNGDDFESKAFQLDKTKPIFVYCMVGGRSKKAATKLCELGFSKVYDLNGGIMKWNAAGLAKPSDKISGICSEEYGDLMKSNKRVLVNFYADWCEPCRKMAPYILKMQSDLKDTLSVVRLNADENKTIISDLKLDGLPVLLLYENGNLKWSHTGFISEEALKKQVE